MKTFADTTGRTWTVAVNVDAIKRVKSLLSVNLLDIVDGKSGLLEQLSSDPVTLCDVLFALVKPDADARGVSDEDFGRAMGGDALDGATAALLEELSDFFPAGLRTLLKKALAKIQQIQTLVLKRAEERLDDPKLNAELLATIAGELSGGSQGSSGLPPGP